LKERGYKDDASRRQVHEPAEAVKPLKLTSYDRRSPDDFPRRDEEIVPVILR
jgi:hypothetical protein